MSKVNWGDKVKAHLEEADFSIRQAVDVLAEGSADASNAACMIAIADCLLAFGMMQYEIRENMIGSYSNKEEKE